MFVASPICRQSEKQVICKTCSTDEASRNKMRLSLTEKIKPGFHIVVSVVSVVRKKFIGQIQLYGNLPYKCSMQKKRQIQLSVRDRMLSVL